MAKYKDGSFIGRPTKQQQKDRAFRAKMENKEAWKRLEAMKSEADIEKEKADIEKQKTEEVKKQFEFKRNQLSIEESIKNIHESVLGKLKEKFSLESDIQAIKEGQSSEDPKQQEGAKKYAKLLEGVSSGAIDLDGVLASIAMEGAEGVENFGPFLPLVVDLAEKLEKMPDLGDKIKVEASVQAKLDAMLASVQSVSEILQSRELMGVAAFGVLVKLVGDFIGNAKEVRQELGLSVTESAALGAEITIADKALTLMGGRSGEIKNFATGIAAEFGNVGEITTGVALQAAKISAFTGLSGQNMAVLAKQIQVVQGGSLETSLNMIETYDSIARAAGVAPGLVLADIAQSTKLFAEYAKDGGENIAEAAAQAAKLGINLDTVGQIAESLLNIEQSLTNEMEAEVLLGRSLNLDKARELALMGDLEGLQKEITDGLVSQAEWSDMNVIQRRAMADAIGVSVQDMAKMVAGEQTSAQLAKEREEAQISMMEMLAESTKMMGVLQGLNVMMLAIDHKRNMAKDAARAKDAAEIVKKGTIFGLSMGTMVATMAMALGGLVLIPALLAMAKGAFSTGKALAGAEEGGEITKTGAIMAHKGEVFSGTKNEMGFGTDMTETNKLLKQSLGESKMLREQNQLLMNKLIRTTGDLQLANA